MGELVILLLFGAVCLYFLSASRVRELAIQAVGRASRDANFQWLDQSVHIRRISLSRDETGQWRMWRQYRFDYSYDGLERRHGFVIMLGRRMQSIVMAEREPLAHD